MTECAVSGSLDRDSERSYSVFVIDAKLVLDNCSSDGGYGALYGSEECVLQATQCRFHRFQRMGARILGSLGSCVLTDCMIGRDSEQQDEATSLESIVGLHVDGKGSVLQMVRFLVQGNLGKCLEVRGPAHNITAEYCDFSFAQRSGVSLEASPSSVVALTRCNMRDNSVAVFVQCGSVKLLLCHDSNNSDGAFIARGEAA